MLNPVAIKRPQISFILKINFINIPRLSIYGAGLERKNIRQALITPV